MPQITRYSIMFALLYGNFNLTLVIGQDLILAESAAKCYSDNSGSIQANLTMGNAPYLFILSSDSLRKSEIKRSPLLKESTYIFNEVAAGNYYVTAICSDGKVYSQHAIINQPPQLRPGKISVEASPSSVSSMDGIVIANPTGGTPPYIFSWEGIGVNGTDKKISALGNGIYKCTIKDSLGCGPVSCTIILRSKAAAKSTSYFYYKNGGNNSLIQEAVYLIIN